MQQQLAFLSYTRGDDAFYGRYISSFRKILENGVHVVTGERTFQIFQDIEGIVIGENWRKKLAEVINRSSFLIPMMSPLFFSSGVCREEVKQFFERERVLGRRDLVLPIYFSVSPKLEKEEEKAKDPLVMELAERQRVDWRKLALVPLTRPSAKKAILRLAGEIADAMARLNSPSSALAERISGILPPVSLGNDGLSIGPRVSTQHSPNERHYATLARDAQLSEGVVGDLKREKVSPRNILWVDDRPDNNIWERRALEAYGVRFVLALDTAGAKQLLFERGPFAAIISDLGRPGDWDAGFTLLKQTRAAGVQTPYFIYTSPGATKRWSEAQILGAQGMTADPDALIEMVVGAFR